MKVNVKQVLKDYSGKNIIQRDGDQEKELTLADVLVTVINFQDKDAKLTPKESVLVYRESVKIMDAESTIDLDIDTIKLIQDNVVKVYGPLVSGQVISILESN